MEELTIWLRLSPRRGERCPEKASSKRRGTTSQTWHFLNSNNNNNYCYFCYYRITRHFYSKLWLPSPEAFLNIFRRPIGLPLLERPYAKASNFLSKISLIQNTHMGYLDLNSSES